jgi:hypothetical protein
MTDKPQLEALARKHGQLGPRLIQLRKPQQEEIANAAYEEGFIFAMNALQVSADHLGQAMHVAGYGQCGGCEEWFPQLELEESEGADFLEVGENPKRCIECKTAEDTEWAAPPPPEPTTPEEIAAAEEKRQRARDAVIAQEQRRVERQGIVQEFEREQGTNDD